MGVRLHARGSQTFERIATFAGDADGDGRGGGSFAQRGGLFAEIARAIAGGFNEAIAQGQFGNEFSWRRFGGAHGTPDEREIQFTQSARRPVATVSDVVDEIEFYFLMQFAHDAP